MKILQDLKSRIENAGPLFQLLMKSGLDRPDISMALIQILEGFLGDYSNGGLSVIGTQLRVAFLNDFLKGGVLNRKDNQNQANVNINMTVNNLQLPIYLKNKICQFLLKAFILERQANSWPTALTELIEIFACHEAVDPVKSEIFLRWCLMLTDEISPLTDGTLSENEMKRNADLRDSMRLGDNSKLCEYWRQVLTLHLRSSQHQHNSSISDTILSLTLDCLAKFSKWIDVALIVETETLKLIYTALQYPRESVQLTAGECLAEIVAKGMRASDKIQLANYMNLTSVFAVMSERGQVNTFFSKICKVMNSLGYSLIQQVHLNPQTQAQTQNATADGITSILDQVVNYITPVVLPHLLRFLEILAKHPSCDRDDDWIESLKSLVPFITALFEIFRSFRENPHEEHQSSMLRVLPFLLEILELNEDDDMKENDADEDQDDNEDDDFLNLIRPTLFNVFDSIFSLQGHATLSHINSLKTHCSMSKCELISRLVLRIPDNFKGHPSFVITINGVRKVTPMGELVTWTIDRVPGLFPNLTFITAEVLVRYGNTSFLDSIPEKIDDGIRIIVNLVERSNYSSRSSDLLLKFVKSLKGKLSGYSQALISLLQGPISSGLIRSTGLYEVIGLSVASLDQRAVQLSPLLGLLLQSTLERCLCIKSSNDMNRASEAVDLLSSFAKGFVCDTCLDPTPVRSWFSNVSSFIVQLLEEGSISHLANNSLYVIAVIGLTQRLIPLCQVDSIPLVTSLTIFAVSHHSNDCSVLATLLPLIAASIFKLRDQFNGPSVLGRLWPKLVESVYRALNQPILGTDDLLQHFSLSKNFISLLQAIVAFPVAMSSTLPTVPLENILKTVLDLLIDAKSGGVDRIGLIRSCMGIIAKTHMFLNKEFLFNTILPIILLQAIPVIFAELDPANRKHLQALPAGVVQMVHDCLGMLRVVDQTGEFTAKVLNLNVKCGEAKDLKIALLNYFLINK